MRLNNIGPGKGVSRTFISKKIPFGSSTYHLVDHAEYNLQIFSVFRKILLNKPLELCNRSGS